MAGIDYPGAKFKLPAVLQPTGTRCLKVTIPDDDDYHQVFLGLLDLLTWSRFHDDDPTFSHAAIVSRWWEKVIGANPPEVIGCTLLEDVRQKPNEPCTLQKYIEGEWIDWADLTLCRDMLTVPPIYTDPQGDRSPAGATLDDILWWYKVLITQVITDIDGDVDPPVEKANQTAFTGGQTGTDTGPGIAQIVDAISGHTPAERATELAAIPWEDLRHDGLCATMNFSVVNDTQNWLDALSDFLVEEFNDSSNWLVYALSLLNQALGGGGGNGLLRAGWAAGGGGSGFGYGADPEDCGGWELDLDLTVTDGALIPQLNMYGQTCGEHTDAWHPSLVYRPNQRPDVNIGCLDLIREGTRLFSIDTFEMWFDATPNTGWSFSSIQWIDQWDAIHVISATTDRNVGYLSGGSLTLVKAIRFYCEGVREPQCALCGETGARYTRIKLTGPGSNPF